MASRVWTVSGLCHAISDILKSRFNPVSVQGEISGFTRASSGHCYFSLKDDAGQMRCAMFRRSADHLNFVPRDGDLVEVQGRVGLYEPRGELQLVVEAMRPAGAGQLHEAFIRLKAKLEAEGLFDASRKRDIPKRPRAIGVVTSLGAAALHDVATALQRRVPHIPVRIAPSLVQGADAPAQLVAALQALQALPDVDVILLVRGGGSIEDLWAFNDESLARALVSCKLPVICGRPHPLLPLRCAPSIWRATCCACKSCKNPCRRPCIGAWTKPPKPWTVSSAIWDGLRAGCINSKPSATAWPVDWGAASLKVCIANA
jgi:exodeoxyribonuclease VII large subunit